MTFIFYYIIFYFLFFFFLKGKDKNEYEMDEKERLKRSMRVEV